MDTNLKELRLKRYWKVFHRVRGKYINTVLEKFISTLKFWGNFQMFEPQAFHIKLLYFEIKISCHSKYGWTRLPYKCQQNQLKDRVFVSPNWTISEIESNYTSSSTCPTKISCCGLWKIIKHYLEQIDFLQICFKLYDIVYFFLLPT